MPPCALILSRGYAVYERPHFAGRAKAVGAKLAKGCPASSEKDSGRSIRDLTVGKSVGQFVNRNSPQRNFLLVDELRSYPDLIDVVV
jgi:hypothetical protein